MESFDKGENLTSEVKSWQSERSIEEFKTTSNTFEPKKKPLVAKDLNAEELQASVCTDGNVNGNDNLPINAITRHKKHGSSTHQTRPVLVENPKSIARKAQKYHIVEDWVDLSLYRPFPKDQKAINKRKQFIENEYFRIELENQRKATRNKELRDELYISYGWVGDNDSLLSITKKLHQYKKAGEEKIALQRREIRHYKAPAKPSSVETFDGYLRGLSERDIDDDKPPGQIPTPRIRRKIEEGSYPNWSVVEDKLPTLLRYTWKGKQSKIIKYLENERKHWKINNEDRQGRTALHYAASWGCVKILRILLRVPGIDVNKRDKDGKTPLYKAVEINSFECVQALVESGANCRIPARNTRDPLTAVMHLYGDERFKMFETLYEYGCYSDDEEKPYCLTLLHKSIASQKDKVNLRIVNFLIEQGHNVNAIEGKSRTPLHLAAICGRTDLLYLLHAHGANIFHVDYKMKYVKHYVSQGDNNVMKNMLLEFYEHGPPSVDRAMTYREADKNAENEVSFPRHHM